MKDGWYIRSNTLAKWSGPFNVYDSRLDGIAPDLESKFNRKLGKGIEGRTGLCMGIGFH